MALGISKAASTACIEHSFHCLQKASAYWVERPGGDFVDDGNLA